MTTNCGDEDMERLLAAIRSGAGDELECVERLADAYPADARLHFLRGSILAGAGRPIEAHAALARAVSLAPDFALARFQLGFFELTSGEARRALSTWEPLADGRAEGYLADFVAGLTDLIHDRFAEAIVALRRGIAVNEDNPALNHDMQLIVGRCEAALDDGTMAPPGESSVTSFLLGQLDSRGTTH